MEGRDEYYQVKYGAWGNDSLYGEDDGRKNEVGPEEHKRCYKRLFPF